MSLPTLSQMIQGNNNQPSNQANPMPAQAPPQNNAYPQPCPNNNPYPSFDPNQQGYQGNPGYSTVPQSSQGYQPGMESQGSAFGWANEINKLQGQYGMQIPPEQIDASFEQAKQNKRMYKFPAGPDNYIRFDERGKSYITIANAFDWAHKSNPQHWETRKNPNCYAGTAAFLKAVCWLDTSFSFNHVKPGNYQLYLNQGFESPNIKEKLTLKVMVGDNVVFTKDPYPDPQMVNEKNLKEYYICDIKRESFDMSKADANGDLVVKIVFGQKDNNWKKGWVLDGARLLETY